MPRSDIRPEWLNRQYRLRWEGVWTCQVVQMRRAGARHRYMKPLLTKDQLAALHGVSAQIGQTGRLVRPHLSPQWKRLGVLSQTVELARGAQSAVSHQFAQNS